MGDLLNSPIICDVFGLPPFRAHYQLSLYLAILFVVVGIPFLVKRKNQGKLLLKLSAVALLSVIINYGLYILRAKEWYAAVCAGKQVSFELKYTILPDVLLVLILIIVIALHQRKYGKKNL